MHHVLRRAALVAGATTTTLALTAGSAFAHECYIANQSAKGAKAAGTNSQVWHYVDFVGSLLEEGFWTEEQAACVREGASEAGVRTGINLMGKVPRPHDGVLGSKNPHIEDKMGDGKGIDHFFSSGQIVPLIMIADECGAPIPED